ncbi:hypothetical protein PHYPSEUDO_002281 [Phytophthora pseudosyringae]|uniref:Uncharacterized protein n=1 Tax=Phytophthora pseudosyringae TaxID=221518 RepID=A0A8T1VTI6_9STRA|nr:hypothetical protein PHYPSEUDO_002281 [Phytophthora pseudosyringae]
MIAELLRLIFADGDVKRRLESAQTKTQTALAWQHFSSVLSESVGVVINRDQVSQKYRKLKCSYRKEKRESGKTGNCARDLREIDDALCVKPSQEELASGEVLLDSHFDAAEDEGSDSSGVDQRAGGASGSSGDEPTATAGRTKTSPIENLATAMQAGMEAIAASMTARASPEKNGISSLAATLQRQHEETRQFQALQLQLLQQLVANNKSQ